MRLDRLLTIDEYAIRDHPCKVPNVARYFFAKEYDEAYSWVSHSELALLWCFVTRRSYHARSKHLCIVRCKDSGVADVLLIVDRHRVYKVGTALISLSKPYASLITLSYA